MMSRVVSLVLVSSSAILFAIAQPGEFFRSGNIMVAMVSLVPYFWVLLHQSVRHRYRLAWVFGFIVTVISHYWLIFFDDFALWTLGSIAIGYGFVHIFLAHVITRIMHFSRWHRPFVIALMWSGYEFIKSIGYLGFPWAISGLSVQQSLLLVQHIDITGIWSLNLLIALSNCFIVELIIDNGRVQRWLARALCFFAILIVLIVGYGAVHLLNPPKITDSVPMLLVQQNTDSWSDSGATALRTNVQLTHQALQQADIKPELVLWSETSIRSAYNIQKDTILAFPPELPLGELLGQNNLTLITGTPYYEVAPHNSTNALEARVYNGAVQIAPNGDIEHHYGKRHLIPFAEHVPGWSIPFLRTTMQQIIGLTGSWNISKQAPLFTHTLSDGRVLKFGVLICFEDSFGDLALAYTRRDSDILVNLTNNSWSKRDSAQIQHLYSARLRAIEARQALVRSTNSGISGVVDALGRINNPLNDFDSGATIVHVPLYRHEPITIYSRWGDWFGNLLLFGALIVYAISFTPWAQRRWFATGIDSRIAPFVE